MAVDVKDINRHDSAGTEYPGIAADELNILVERVNADEELLKANLGAMIGGKVDTQKGVAGGLATLGADGKLTPSQLPDVDDVIVVTALPSSGTGGKLYILAGADGDAGYRWNGTQWAKQYDSKTEQGLADEVTARTQETTALQQKTNALQKQIDNITEAEDLLSEVDYANGENAVPANVSEYAEVSVLKGVGRIANNLGKAINSTNWEPYSSTYANISFADGVATVSWNASASSSGTFLYGFKQKSPYNIYAGHRYLLSYEIYSSKDLKYVDESIKGAYIGPAPAPICEANKWTKIAYVVSASANNSTRTSLIYPNYNQSFVEGDYYRVRNYILTDLTQYFSSDPSVDVSTLTITDIQQRYPQLLEPRAYNAGSIVDITYSAVKSVGKNLVSGYVAQEGFWNTDGWQATAGIKSSVKIPVRAGATYIGSFYDKQGNRINDLVYTPFVNEDDAKPTRLVTNSTITLTGDEKYLAVRNYSPQSSYITANNYEYQLEEGSSATSYTPYQTDTLTLPSPVTLRSAGSVADTDELNVEVDGVEKRRQTGRVGSYTFTGQETWNAYAGSDSIFFLEGLPAKYEVGSMVVCDGLAGKTAGTGSSYPNESGIIWLQDASDYPRLYVKIASGQDVNTVTQGFSIRYPLADPVVTLSDPITDPFIQVEGGGTIKTVQSQSPKIDGAMTITYVNKVTA